MKEPKLTTLCYLTKGRDVLFMVKADTKKNRKNMNAGKYLGVGGHMEEGESPQECALREIYEETGIVKDDIGDFSLRGIATFINDSCDDEIMFIYKGEYRGAADPCPGTCDEGRLVFVPVEKIYDIPTWEGDRAIFRHLFEKEEKGMFEIKLIYEGDRLIRVIN